MHTCKVCKEEITPDKECSCNPDLCAMHCECDPKCQCGCQDKKQQAESDK